MGPRAHTAHSLETQIRKDHVLNSLASDEATDFARQMEGAMTYARCSSSTVQRAAGWAMQLSVYSK